LRIRPFSSHDLESVVRLANAQALFDGPITEADLAVAHNYPDGLRVAEDEGEIVGFVFGYLKEMPAAVLATWGARGVGYVELLVVAPGYRRKGVGQALLDSLMKEFKQSGLDMVLLHCPAEAKAAKNLYEKNGFGVAAYHMRKRM